MDCSYDGQHVINRPIEIDDEFTPKIASGLNARLAIVVKDVIRLQPAFCFVPQPL
jgi:hypothetical protein